MLMLKEKTRKFANCVYYVLICELLIKKQKLCQMYQKKLKQL